MAKRRPELYAFGPEAMRALIEIIIDEFNRNRVWHGQTPITYDQVLTQFKQHFDAAIADTDKDEPCTKR